MIRIQSLVVALIIHMASADRAAAQSPVSMEALTADRASVGTAGIISARIVAGDSLIVSVKDAPLTMELVEAGEWLFGGLDQPAKAVSRTEAIAIRSGLPAETSVKIIAFGCVP
ncbi:hypothetical protein [Gemmatimonas sp.]|uniref:hypothetical protein n=1 Tax=Gemmatimonas sp. TaxID=1962908 RepID=UPI0039836626